MTHRCAVESVKLHQELNRHPEKSGDQQQTEFSAIERNPVHHNHRHHAQAREQKPVEHHVPHAQLGERDLAEVKARTPESSRERTGSVAQSCPGWGG